MQLFVTVIVLGLDPLAAALVGYVAAFYGMFQHWNVRTPRWLGYFIQRPEAHCEHHRLGVHANNYGDLPLWDMLFGTLPQPGALRRRLRLRVRRPTGACWRCSPGATSTRRRTAAAAAAPLPQRAEPGRGARQEPAAGTARRERRACRRAALQQSADEPSRCAARPLRPPGLAALPRRQRLRLDRRRGDVVSPARRLGRRRHELRRHRRRLFALGAGPRRRRVGNDHRQVVPPERQAQPRRPRDQGRQAHGRRPTRACRRPTSGAPSRRRCARLQDRRASTSTSRTTTTPRRRSRRRSPPSPS